MESRLGNVKDNSMVYTGGTCTPPVGTLSQEYSVLNGSSVLRLS